MVVIVVIGSILAFITRSISKVSIDNNLARFKKAYAGIEDAISFLINDEIIYGTSSGFKDTEAVTLQNIGEIIGQSGVNKFRDAFKFRMHYVEDRINCPIYGGISSSGCFMTNYGVVFGIPDTDFVRTGTVKSKDSDNQTIDVVPITFYTNYEGRTNR